MTAGTSLDRSPAALRWPLAAVCRATGLGEHTLRAWERRFGFPRPERLPSGHRRYPPDQVERLRLVARALARGHRAGAVVPLSTAALEKLLAGAESEAVQPSAVAALLGAVRAFDRDALAALLQQGFARDGVGHFLRAAVVPVLAEVGRQWAAGRLEIRHEHLLSEVLQDILRALHRSLEPRASGRPVVLATLPGERHALGLQMVALTIAVAGRPARPLGTETPAEEIAAAADELRPAAVGVSVSAATASADSAAGIARLAALLPAGVALWVGGAGARRLARLPRAVERFASLDDLERALGRIPA